MRNDGVRVRAKRVKVSEEDDEWMAVEEERHCRGDFFDLTLMRKEPPVDEDFVNATRLLDWMPAPVINAPSALRGLSEKLSIFRYAEWIAPTWVGSRADEADEFRQQQGAVVLKPLDGMGGQGIYVATEEDRNFRSVFDLLSAFGEKKIMMQAYLPAAREADHRVFVVGGKPLDFMLVRTPRADDHRGNLAAGGTGVARPLDSDARRLVEGVGADLLAAGVHFAGLDVIGGKLVEVNITCPTGLRQVRDQTGEAVDEAIVGYFFSLVR